MAGTGRVKRGITTVLFMLGATFVYVSVLAGINLVARERVRDCGE